MISEIFKKHDDEFSIFSRVENKKSQRGDIHAFILLDELFPNKRDIISCAEHDQIWLSIESDEIESLTEEQIVELIRCGIMYDEENETLSMFV